MSKRTDRQSLGRAEFVPGYGSSRDVQGGAPTNGVQGFAPACTWQDLTNGIFYVNAGTFASSSWVLAGGVGGVTLAANNAFTGNNTFAGTSGYTGTITITDVNIVLSAVTGTILGTAVTQKLAFWGATPIVQPASANQAVVTQTQTTLTDSTGGSVSTTLAAITAPAANATTSLTADMGAAKNAIASLAAELALIKTDVANTLVLLHALRTALLNSGLVKGAA